ncbi:hypothetical protein CcCBS67573_g01900 [Chytriomyces confervae]|uniref:Protein root UVB sensitive/RUS domain-containing protein n=1 Tax=Chytriomyces confervae TaxID=246404 RepID=A0A507FKA2_9FUNG|nr:hypothetical protein HDU80_003275 [Chytriomyces hyalinus]TPX76829.1 hypothetical protein CcCBS67573_g01900 [Chytriomyces confervae]
MSAFRVGVMRMDACQLRGKWPEAVRRSTTAAATRVISQRVCKGESVRWTTITTTALPSAENSPSSSKASENIGNPSPASQSSMGASRWLVSTSNSNHDISQNDSTKRSNTGGNATAHLIFALRDQLMVMFLPKGFPGSVTPDYFKYTVWQFMHSVSGTVTGTLSTQALLHALGLGAAASAGLAATTNWIIKDGFGLLGGVLYAGSVATKFDDQPKRFRFLSAGLIQLSTLLELLTPLLPHLFVPIASISNIGKNIGWLASSASRAAIHRGFTLSDNLGDVTAKSGAQSTMAGLLGTVVGIGVSYFIGYSDPFTLLNIFLPLSAFNMYCCYQSNHVVVTRSLNVERGELALSRFAESLVSSQAHAISKHTKPTLPDLKQMLDSEITPLQQVSQLESFIHTYRSKLGVNLALEPQMSKHMARVRVETLSRVLDEQAGKLGPYRILLSQKRGMAAKPSKNGSTAMPGFLTRWVSDSLGFFARMSHEIVKRLPWTNKAASQVGPMTHEVPAVLDHRALVCLWFLEDSGSVDHFRAFYHTCLARVLFRRRIEAEASAGIETRQSFEDLQQEFQLAVEDTAGLVEATFTELNEKMVEMGWHVEFNHFGDRDARLRL